MYQLNECFPPKIMSCSPCSILCLDKVPGEIAPRAQTLLVSARACSPQRPGVPLSPPQFLYPCPGQLRTLMVPHPLCCPPLTTGL